MSQQEASEATQHASQESNELTERTFQQASQVVTQQSVGEEGVTEKFQQKVLFCLFEEIHSYL